MLLPCVLRQSGVFINGVTVGRLAWACSSSDEADKRTLEFGLEIMALPGGQTIPSVLSLVYVLDV